MKLGKRETERKKKSFKGGRASEEKKKKKLDALCIFLSLPINFPSRSILFPSSSFSWLSRGNKTDLILHPIDADFLPKSNEDGLFQALELIGLAAASSNGVGIVEVVGDDDRIVRARGRLFLSRGASSAQGSGRHCWVSCYRW